MTKKQGDKVVAFAQKAVTRYPSTQHGYASTKAVALVAKKVCKVDRPLLDKLAKH